MAQTLAVDATPLISAILGGRAREIIYSEMLELYAPEATLFEVPKHIRWLASELHQPELKLYEEFQLFPITACQPAVYDKEVERAAELIGQRDPLDIPLVALALARDYPIWSDDRDFEGIAEIRLFRTVFSFAVAFYYWKAKNGEIAQIKSETSQHPKLARP